MGEENNDLLKLFHNRIVEPTRADCLLNGQDVIDVEQALSLQLIKGCIDQVDEIVHVTWVSPRVLDKEQLAVMGSKLTEWQTDINKVEHLVQDGAKTIIGY